MTDLLRQMKAKMKLSKKVKIAIVENVGVLLTKQRKKTTTIATSYMTQIKKFIIQHYYLLNFLLNETVFFKYDIW